MAREIVTHTWCDICLMNDDEQVPGQEVTIQIGTFKPRLLAVCERHNAELIEPLRELLSELPTVDAVTAAPPKARTDARKGKVTAPQPIDTTCRICGKELGTNDSFHQHVRQQHDLGRANYRAKFPDQFREPSEEDHEKFQQDTLTFEEVPYTPGYSCTEEGCDYDAGKFARPSQSLGVHKARTHGIRREKVTRSA